MDDDVLDCPTGTLSVSSLVSAYVRREASCREMTSEGQQRGLRRSLARSQGRRRGLKQGRLASVQESGDGVSWHWTGNWKRV
jgi:hypothetical protein